MTKEEARRFLEQNGFCLKHDAQFDPSKGPCPACAAEVNQERAKKMDLALQVLRAQEDPRIRVPTMGVTIKASGVYAVINESDFNEELHTKAKK